MDKAIENPFVIGKYAGDDYFCDREKETQLLLHQLTNGRDVALVSPRRMGKTGLICHLFQQKEIKDRYYTFFIDIYSASSLEEMAYLMGKTIFEVLKPIRNKAAEMFLQVVKSLRAGLKIDPQTGMPIFDLSIGDIKSPQTTIDEIFEYLAHADKPCIVAIDEFQQIANFKEKNVEAILRTKIQHCPNARWIFAGSQRHLLMEMFTSSKRPFYQSAITYYLPPIPKEEYSKFCHRLFNQYDKKLQNDIPELTYQRFGACTWYLQMVMNELFSITPCDSLCQIGWIDQAITNILDAHSGNYMMTLSQLSTRQKGLLQAIAKAQTVEKITSEEFITTWNLGSSSSVQSALRRLVDLDIVTCEDGIYRLTDYFFAQWLRENY